MKREPVLDARDIEIFDAWMRQAEVWSQTKTHRAKVARALSIVEKCMTVAPNAAVMWSGGKDSTALTHLVCSNAGHSLRVISEKDDLDFPGEREYVTSVARQFGWDLHVISPATSPKAWIASHASELIADGDFHSRAAGLSKECFYDLVESASREFGAIFLGLRQEESKGRALNRATHGVLYKKKSGQYTCTPIADWSGIDVYAYLVSHEVPILDVYRCVGFMHADEPFRVRKSWWIPGASGRWGGIAWLKRYWPSLYAQLCDWMPDARMHA